jgi:hypothetical protein
MSKTRPAVLKLMFTTALAISTGKSEKRCGCFHTNHVDYGSRLVASHGREDVHHIACIVLPSRRSRRRSCRFIDVDMPVLHLRNSLTQAHHSENLILRTITNSEAS